MSWIALPLNNVCRQSKPPSFVILDAFSIIVFSSLLFASLSLSIHSLYLLTHSQITPFLTPFCFGRTERGFLGSRPLGFHDTIFIFCYLQRFKIGVNFPHKHFFCSDFFFFFLSIVASDARLPCTIPTISTRQHTFVKCLRKALRKDLCLLLLHPDSLV